MKISKIRPKTKIPIFISHDNSARITTKIFIRFMSEN
jgi:hypothetical protein